jgi:HEAT repeat protein
MRGWTVYVALIIPLCVCGCSRLSERELADLRSPNDAVKRGAIQRISKGDQAPVGFVNRLFFDEMIAKKGVVIMVDQLRGGKESESIQVSILKALGKLGRRMEVPVSPIIEKLEHESPRIRLQAVETLGKLKDKQAVPALLELLDSETNKYPIIWSLGEIGDQSAVPALNRLLSDEDQYVRYNADKALSKIR